MFPTIFTASAIVAAFSPDMLFLTVCRFLMGVGLGATYPCGFGAMSEFSPVEKRGRYQAWVGLIANTGTPVATLLCTFLLPVVGWRAITSLFCSMGVIIILCIIKWLPESPRWLANKGRNDEADARVTFMENQMRELGHVVEDIPDEEIAKMVEEAKNQPKELPYRFLFTKKMLPRTIVAGLSICKFCSCLHDHCMDANNLRSKRVERPVLDCAYYFDSYWYSCWRSST